MADRYWVGGTGTWNATTTNWSATSGGASGASAPTASDNAIFNSASGASSYTVTIAAAGGAKTCLDLNISGPATGTVTFGGGGVLNVSGNITVASSGVSYTNGFTNWIGSTSVNFNIGSSIGALTVNGTGSCTLQNALTITPGALTLLQGTLNFNNFAVSAANYDSSSVATSHTLAFGTSTLTLTGSGAVVNATNDTGATITFSAGAKIRLTSASTKTFNGNGYSWPTLENGGAGALVITGANTFADLTTTVTPASFTFPASTTNTFSAFSLSGTAGNTVTLRSSSTGTQYTLSKASGIINANYLDIKDSAATGGATWNALIANGNVNSGNNTGWVFTVPSGNNTGLMMSMGLSLR